MEERLERMEKMLATLIGMVGDIKNEQTLIKQEQHEMKKDIVEIKQEQHEMKKDIVEIKQEQRVTQEGVADVQDKQEKQHNEIMHRLVSIEIDKELTWDKVIQNERELLRFKKQSDLKDFT
ncbi:hypothetical protein ACUIJN_25720 [Metabacillus halosaccharovorans]|uniref:hypothetical protein n=1 Tax=Metabacillus halosaccharovorans TaxID=930124 RepID=UPI00403D72C8